MKLFHIKPGIGIGPIEFGMSINDVHLVLGEPEISEKDKEIYLGGIIVHYSSHGKVEFIETASSDQYQCLYQDQCLHNMLADDVLELVCQQHEYDKTDPEVGYSYIFLQPQLSLWRGTMPEEDQEDDDPEGRYFEAVGLAMTGYFKQTR